MGCVQSTANGDSKASAAGMLAMLSMLVTFEPRELAISASVRSFKP
jgi:hypothetical protein